MKAKYIGSAILVFLFFGIATLPVRAQDAPVVAAAADLQFAITEIAEAFKKGNLGVMDYQRYKNVQADTQMRASIAGTTDAPGADS